METLKELWSFRTSKATERDERASDSGAALELTLNTGQAGYHMAGCYGHFIFQYTAPMQFEALWALVIMSIFSPYFKNGKVKLIKFHSF